MSRPFHDGHGAWNVPAVRRGLLLLLFGLYVALVARTAWLSDDAYITLRTVDNFIHGRGLVFNPGERVQAYTHPLWLVLMTFATGVTREFYLTPMILSGLASIAAVAVLIRRVPTSRVGAAVALLVLTCSKAFVDFSTSGLENGLLALLFALFFATLLRVERAPNARRDLALLAAAALLTRPDAALLFGPGLAVAFLPVRRAAEAADPPRGEPIRALAFGAAPLLAWEGFSLIYYGFPLPNTAYAKLASGVPAEDLVRQGGLYLANSFRWDPLTLCAIAAGCAAGFGSRRRAEVAVSAGILLHLAYVVRIGGDFMSGRFLVPALFAAAALLSRARWGTASASVALLATAAIGLAAPFSPLRSGPDYGSQLEQAMAFRTSADRIADERAVYYQRTGLLRAGSDGRVRFGGSAALAERARGSGRRVETRGAIGMLGFVAGPDLHVIDVAALADPLLARIPVSRTKAWRAGHFFRDPPEGYEQSIELGGNRLANPDLAAFYDRILLITRGPLFDAGRLRAILAMNAGRYEPLVARYEAAEKELAGPAAPARPKRADARRKAPPGGPGS